MQKYTDISTNFMPHPDTGDLSIIKGSMCIKRSIKNIIMSNLYDRPFSTMNAGISRSLFELSTEQTSAATEKRIRLALDNYEPRAIVDQVIVSTNENTMTINISYETINDPTIQILKFSLERNR